MKSLSELIAMDKALLLYLLEQNFGIKYPYNTPRYDLINVYRDKEIGKLVDKKIEQGLAV